MLADDGVALAPALALGGEIAGDGVVLGLSRAFAGNGVNVKLLKTATPPCGLESLIPREIDLVAGNVVSLTAAEAPSTVICWVASTAAAPSVYLLAFGTVPSVSCLNVVGSVLWIPHT